MGIATSGLAVTGLIGSDGDVLGVGATADGDIIIRSGSNIVGALPSALTAKTTLVAADLAMIGDSAASGALKSVRLDIMSLLLGATYAQDATSIALAADAAYHAVVSTSFTARHGVALVLVQAKVQFDGAGWGGIMTGYSLDSAAYVNIGTDYEYLVGGTLRFKWLTGLSAASHTISLGYRVDVAAHAVGNGIPSSILIFS